MYTRNIVPNKFQCSFLDYELESVSRANSPHQGTPCSTISERSQSVPSSSSQPPNPASTPTPSKRRRINNVMQRCWSACQELSPDTRRGEKKKRWAQTLILQWILPPD